MDAKPGLSPLEQQTLQQAQALLRAGRAEQALELMSEHVRQNPQAAEMARMLALLQNRLGRRAEAVTTFEHVRDLRPQQPQAWSDLAQAWINLGRHDQALDVLEQGQAELAGELQTNHDMQPAKDKVSEEVLAFLTLLAQTRKSVGFAAEALRPLDSVLHQQPDNVAGWVMQGDLFKALGKPADAAASYRHALKLDPGNAAAWWSLSNLKADAFSDTERELVQSLAQRPGLPAELQIYLEFALANALEQQGDHAAAFTHFRAGNRLKGQLLGWRREEFRAWLEQLNRNVDAGIIAEIPQRSSQPRPLFIVSLPRSGSTLVEQILAAHSEVAAASELPWLPMLVAEESKRRSRSVVTWCKELTDADWRVLGEKYLERARHWSRQVSVFTDKLPGNLPYIGVILSMLPQAQVVVVRRAAMDVCWSCYRQLFPQGADFSYDLVDLASYWQDMERHADYWEGLRPGRVLSVQYESLVSDPETETRRLLHWCGLPFESACLKSHRAERAVNTASASQVREPIHQRGVDHWQKYAEQLGELRQALELAALSEA